MTTRKANAKATAGEGYQQLGLGMVEGLLLGAEGLLVLLAAGLVGLPAGGGWGMGQGGALLVEGVGRWGGGSGARMLMERSQVVASSVQFDSGLLIGKTPKPWPPLAKMWSSAGIFAALRALK
jgi:hypothetical protein